MRANTFVLFLLPLSVLCGCAPEESILGKWKMTLNQQGVSGDMIMDYRADGTLEANFEADQGVNIKIHYTYVRSGNKITTTLKSTEASGPLVDSNPQYKQEIENRSKDRIGRTESMTFEIKGDQMIVTPPDKKKVTLTRVK